MWSAAADFSIELAFQKHITIEFVYICHLSQVSFAKEPYKRDDILQKRYSWRGGGLGSFVTQWGRSTQAQIRPSPQVSVGSEIGRIPLNERWGAGVETQKNVRGEIGGWGRVPFNEPYAPSLSTIYDGA